MSDSSIMAKVLNIGLIDGFIYSILLLFILICLWGVYNAYFHPLSKYPGPKLWAAYYLPKVYYNVTGQLPFKVKEFHDKYGPVVRISPNEITFTSAAAWNDIYGIQPGRIQNQKDLSMYFMKSAGDESNMISANDTVHARARRILGPAFTLKALEQQTPMVIMYSDLLIEKLSLASQQTPVVDMTAWYNFTTFDLTGDLVFGEAFHCLDLGGKYHFFISTILGGIVIGLQLRQLGQYGITQLLVPLMPKSWTKPKDDMMLYTNQMVGRRYAQGYLSEREDVFNYFLNNKKEEDRLSEFELQGNSLLLINAGSETTATLLSAVTYLLCKNPEKLHKVQRELRDMFKNTADITPTSVNSLHYMIAVLSEALRMVPPVPAGLARVISTKGGQAVTGNWIPEGMSCSICQFAAYRSASNFARPEEFIPERWLSDCPTEFRNDVREVLQPFSYGPRGCIGKNLAIAEMRMILAKVLWHFDFELQETGWKDWYESMRVFVVWEKGPLNVRLIPVVR